MKYSEFKYWIEMYDGFKVSRGVFGTTFVSFGNELGAAFLIGKDETDYHFGNGKLPENIVLLEQVLELVKEYAATEPENRDDGHIYNFPVGKINNQQYYLLVNDFGIMTDTHPIMELTQNDIDKFDNEKLRQTLNQLKVVVPK